MQPHRRGQPVHRGRGGGGLRRAGRNRTDCLRIAGPRQGDMAGTVRACSSLVPNIDGAGAASRRRAEARAIPSGSCACGRLVEAGRPG
ncbi:MAG: hypothetical protein R3F43_10730 [bacterium]